MKLKIGFQCSGVFTQVAQVVGDVVDGCHGDLVCRASSTSVNVNMFLQLS